MTETELLEIIERAARDKVIPILAILTTDGFCSIKVYSFVICSQLKENWYYFS